MNERSCTDPPAPPGEISCVVSGVSRPAPNDNGNATSSSESTEPDCGTGIRASPSGYDALPSWPSRCAAATAATEIVGCLVSRDEQIQELSRKGAGASQGRQQPGRHGGLAQADQRARHARRGITLVA